MSATPSRHIDGFVALLGLAVLFGANHVAARVAFDHGLDVPTAVTVRSLVTAAVVGLLVKFGGASVQLTPRQWKVMGGIGVLIAAQSLLLYAAVARIPVGLALLIFNLYSLSSALWVWLLYGSRPERAVLMALPVLFFGLALALDVLGAASGLGAQAQWSRIGAGALFALGAAATFGLVLAFTQQEVGSLDGRTRSLISMSIAGALALVVTQVGGGFHWPSEGGSAGWWGLVGLTVFYGTAYTSVFTLLPRIGVVGSSPIMNVEPVAALGMAWLVLDQVVAPVQMLGAAIVVGTVIALGLRKR